MNDATWVIPRTINGCEVLFAQMVNRECGEFVIAFRRIHNRREGGYFGTAIYKSGLDYWFNGSYGFETETDAHCDAMDRASAWGNNL